MGSSTKHEMIRFGHPSKGDHPRYLRNVSIGCDKPQVYYLSHVNPHCFSYILSACLNKKMLCAKHHHSLLQLYLWHGAWIFKFEKKFVARCIDSSPIMSTDVITYLCWQVPYLPEVTICACLHSFDGRSACATAWTAGCTAGVVNTLLVLWNKQVGTHVSIGP